MNIFDNDGVIISEQIAVVENITKLVKDCAKEILSRYPEIPPQELIYTISHTFEMEIIIAASYRRLKK